MWVNLKSHTVCEDCIIQANVCPIDYQKISTQFTSKDYLASNLLEELHIKCENDREGCEWQDQVQNYRKHRKICPYRKQ